MYLEAHGTSHILITGIDKSEHLALLRFSYIPALDAISALAFAYQNSFRLRVSDGHPHPAQDLEKNSDMTELGL